jgi:hypothetical protein
LVGQTQLLRRFQRFASGRRFGAFLAGSLG